MPTSHGIHIPNLANPRLASQINPPGGIPAGGLFPDGCRYRDRPLDGLAGRIPASIFFGIGFLVISSFSVARFLEQPCTEQ
jgi:hypothetical protein